MGLFGGDSKKTTTNVTENVETKDQTIALGGDVNGTLIGPEAVLGGTGAISADPYSQVTQTITNTSTGATPAEVQRMLDSVFQAERGNSAALSGLASSLSSGLQNQSKQLGDTLAGIQAPTQSALTSLVPLAIVLVLVALIWSASK